MKRLWGIRHLRYWLALIEFNWWWNRIGSLMGAVPNAADLEHLRDIKEGRA